VAEAWGQPDSRELVERMHDEVVATAAGEGVPIDRRRSWDNAVRTYAGTGDHYPSMATDLRLGRRTEIDAISGAVVSRAERHGMAMPATGTIVHLLRAAESLKRA
jgi:2-dehydropantoate 2-reductase